MPIIAWEEMSIMDSVAMAERVDEASYITVIAAKIEDGRATDEDWARLEVLRSRDYQVDAIHKKAEDMANYVTYVPRSWFSKKAPDTLDFDDPETFKLLQPQRFRQLYSLLMMNEAQAENATKN
ncbi:hypothetical protein C8B47_10810 [filamentous cyanobacterium CCP4]|nr:hypothetical protein C8B47_10810 [filamentous cyanobacterium CCP4]